ncbi:MAG TPA: hypothetical protein DCX07_13540 [Phycisphaerales bacterium]|nr:hypothetical protein [Phycisphaerales bacterium]
MVLAHVVLFKVNGQVNRVQCKTCGAEHKYRPPAGRETKTPRLASPRKVAASKKPLADGKKVADLAIRWGEKSRTLSADAPVRNYSMKEVYRVGEVISHPTFGVGFVEKIASDKSFYALFCDSVKLLGMNVG